RGRSRGHRGARPQVSPRQPGRRAGSLAGQVPGRARSPRRSTARGGRVPRAVSAQRVPFHVRTYEGDRPLTNRGWCLSAPFAAAALLIAACEGGNIDAGRDLPRGPLPVGERNPVIVANDSVT